MNIEEIKAKAKELAVKYGQTTVVEFAAWGWPEKEGIATTGQWRVHVIGEGGRDVCETGSDLVLMEADIEKALDPANKMAAALARAEKLEAEAAALRAEVAK